MQDAEPDIGRPMVNRRRVLAAVIGLFAVVGLAWLAYWALVLRERESTDDAYVGGNIVQITPQISGTVVADTTNGSIKVTMDKVDQSKPIAFSSHNGNVDVTLPADTKANLKMRSFRGEIWSDFEMKLTGGQPSTTGGGANGPFRVEYDRTIYGTINGGGVEISCHSFNGRLIIRKK